ncbi:hypothetical protein NitYY0826_C1632 [Nitratiruptor sp. YY08-26]|nr:hypothetical protein NitYY0813_C1630 [Nitratiruptor sp. YY08-13]BCD66685.1 hypothetical protein NitYY0826_C1632 [Nitratiruptor sp. YY08-26]
MCQESTSKSKKELAISAMKKDFINKVMLKYLPNFLNKG